MRRRRQCRTWVILAALALLVAACGQTNPAFGPAGASDASPVEFATTTANATPTTSSTAIATPKGTPIAPPITYATPDGTPTTSQGQAAGWIELPADFTVRTAAQAEAMAFEVAHGWLGGRHPHVASTWLVTRREADQANGSVDGQNEDPFALIWWVNFDNDQYVIPMCPYIPGPGGTPEPCGSSPYAATDVVARTGEQPDNMVGGNYIPNSTSSDMSIPSDARLRTEGEAIAAMLQRVHGVNDGSSPQVTGVRLLSARQWLQEQADQGVIQYLPLAPDTPIWEVSATNAAYAIPCILQDTSKCVLFNVTLALDAVTGDQLMYSGRPATATP